MYYQVLLLDAVADYDLPYVYTYEKPLLRGQLVLVPFGLGNKAREGLILGESSAYPGAKEILKLVSHPLGDEDMDALLYLSHYYATPPAAYGRLFLPKALRVLPQEAWIMKDGLTLQEQQEFLRLLDQDGKALENSGLALKEISYRQRISFPEEEFLFSLVTKEELEERLRKLPPSHHEKRRILEQLIQAFPSPSPRQGRTLSSLKSLEQEGLLVRRKVPQSFQGNTSTKECIVKQLPPLSSKQEIALDEILASPGKLNLLQGVSASGKSYLYLHLALHCLKKKKKFLLLLPDGSLLPAMEEFFRRYFGDQVGVYHAQMSQREEKTALYAFIEGETPVMITTRKGLFLPLDHVEWVLLDEVQEDGYQSKHPYFHGVELASYYGRQGRVNLLFSTATPPISLMLQEDLHRVVLDEPYHKRSLELELVDMRRELSQGNRSAISRSLYAALKKVIQEEGLAFLLMNKRLYASYVFCRHCGEALRCPRCSTSLSYDQARKEVVCSACTYHAPMESTCPHCHSTSFRYYGGGLQQVVEEVRRNFPQAKVLPLDAVTMRKKLGYKDLHRQLSQGKINVLVGTPIIAKGLDFDVDLLAVINADFYLHLPNYRSGEKTFQLLMQFLGRGGRRRASKAILQSYDPKNYVLQHVLRGDVQGFMEKELSLRESRGLPPYSNYLLVILQGEISEVQEQAENMALFLQERTEAQVSEPYGHWTPKERKILVSSKDSLEDVKQLLLHLRQEKQWKFTVEVDPLSTI